MNEDTRQTYTSTTTVGVNSHRATISLRATGKIFWRALIVAAGYMLSSMLAAWLLGRGLQLAGLAISLLSGILIALSLGPIAAQVRASRLSHWAVWGAVLSLNTLSLAIEGAFFAPTLSPMLSMPVAWTAFILFQSLVTAGLVAWLYGRSADATASKPPRKRAWYSWACRFVVSSFSYLLFYFIFGAINYALVTKPYYAAHVSGLAVPPPQMVLMAEMVRAPLIVLSIVPLILLWQGKKGMLAVLCGITLFVIGGIVPLLLNTALPDPLRFASAIEIFFQNFLTGVVAAALLGFVAMKEPMDQ